MADSKKRMAEKMDDEDRQVQKRQRLEDLLDCVLVTDKDEKIVSYKIHWVREFEKINFDESREVKLEADKETIDRIRLILEEPRVTHGSLPPTTFLNMWRFLIKYESKTLIPFMQKTYIRRISSFFNLSKEEYHAFVEFKEDMKAIAECYMTAPKAVALPVVATAFWEAVVQLDYKKYTPPFLVDRIISRTDVSEEYFESMVNHFLTLGRDRQPAGFGKHLDNPRVVKFMKALALRIYQ